MNEFGLIKKYFYRASKQPGVVVGNGDDCAILSPPENQQLAMSIDTLVAGIHFDDTFSPEDIGYKSLAVNLSDLAACGAEPAWAMLSLTLPNADENFLSGFSKGFFTLFEKFPMTLIGGDLTQGPLSITVQVTGFTPTPLLRKGAKVGDAVYVTHELGDAVLALQYLQKKITLSKIEAKQVLPRLYRPTPRIEAAILLRNIATSCIDISDGLYGDLGHILEASHVGAEINVDQIPISNTLKKQSLELQRLAALHSGDAYELCFTAPESIALPPLPCAVKKIGRIVKNSGIVLLDQHKKLIKVPGKSFQHFDK